MRKIALNMVIMLTATMVATVLLAAEDNNQVQPWRTQLGMGIQDYQWKEYGDNDVKLVDETGNLYGLSCEFDAQRAIFSWRAGASVFGGQVDYKGLTWSMAPVKTDVTYAGTEVYADAVPNYRFDSGLWLKAFAGFGFRGWLRDLDDTHTQEGTYVSGAEEWWGSVYGRAGADVSYPIGNNLEIFAEAGTKIPIYTLNHADLHVIGNPTVDLEPEMRFSPFGDLGVRWKQFVVKIRYDTLWFGKSDSVDESGYILHQPESEADIMTFSIAWGKEF